MELKVSQEFQMLIPPLSIEEAVDLEKSILTEGCREALLTWKGYVIDGHNRYAICKKHDIPFKTTEVKGLEVELDVKLWMINNQFSRRNLSTETRLALAYKFKEFEAEKAKARMQATQFKNEEDTASLPVGYPRDEAEEPSNTKGKTLEIIAQKAGVSRATAERYDAIQRKGTKEQKQEVAEGKTSIRKIYNTIQRAERLEKIKTTEWPKDKYRVIYANPPWIYRGSEDRLTEEGLNADKLCQIPVADLTEDNAVLFLRVTATLLPEALRVIEAWGFAYKTNIIWTKSKSRKDNYASINHEHLIVAVKGSCIPDNTEYCDSIQNLQKNKDSERIEEFRNIIDTLYTYGNKLELFSDKKVEGWEVYNGEFRKD